MSATCGGGLRSGACRPEGGRKEGGQWKKEARADARGYKFRAGVVEIATNREISFENERDIFHFFGLRYVPPELRNADG